MGHDVVALPIQATSNAPSRENCNVVLNPVYRESFPTQEQLREFDGIIISGPEHIRPELMALYPDWNKIAVPKVSWMHETVEREDYGRLPIDAIRQLADVTFAPAVQDEKYGLRWLPFGVDTTVFKPDWNQKKLYDTAFIGLVYPKRAEFLEKLKPHLRGINLLVGNIQVHDLSGVCVRETALLYADNLRKIKVFVNLPTLSQLAVTKVYEALACGTFLITPAITEYKNFENLQAHFYDGNKPEKLAESIRFCLEQEEQRVEATRQCCEQVHQLHRLELRCEVLLSAIGGS